MPGQGQAHHQCTEVGFEPDQFERACTHADGEEEAKEAQQLAMSAAIEQPSVQRSHHDHPDHDRNGPYGRKLAGRHNEEANSNQVLDDQDADGYAPGERTGLAALLECLHCKNGAREREGEPDQSRLSGIQVRDERKAGVGSEQEHASDEGCAHGHMRHAPRPHLDPSKRAQVQLEPDPEQEQQNSQFSHQVYDRGRLEAQRVKEESRGQVADERWQPDQRGEKPKPEGGSDETQFHYLLARVFVRERPRRRPDRPTT